MLIEIVLAILTVIVLGVTGLCVYLLIDMNKYKNSNQKVILEIKAKIGSLIREFNVSNIKEFQTDLKQQSEIDILKNGLKVTVE